MHTHIHLPWKETTLFFCLSFTPLCLTCKGLWDEADQVFIPFRLGCLWWLVPSLNWSWAHCKLPGRILDQKGKSHWKESEAWRVVRCVGWCFWKMHISGLWVNVSWCVRSPCCSPKICQKQTEDGVVSDSPSQGAGVSILFAGSRVWNFDEEQFASLDGYEEVGFVPYHPKAVPAHCWPRILPTPPRTDRHTPTHPLPFTLCPHWMCFCCFSQRCFIRHCVVWPGAPAVGAFYEHSLGFFRVVQGQPPHPKQTDRWRNIGGNMLSWHHQNYHKSPL